MKHTYTIYQTWEMMRDSKIDMRLKKRIQHLINVHALYIQAAKPETDNTFAAYAGNTCLTYNAVLYIKILPGQSGGMNIAIEEKDTPKDFMAKVAEICTKYSYLLKEIA